MPYYKNEYQNVINRTLHLLKSKMYEKISELDIRAWVTPEPVTWNERTTGEFRELKKGEKWGDRWDCAWFNLTGRVPGSAKGSSIALIIDLDGEACIFDEKGNPVQGLTPMGSHGHIIIGAHCKRTFRVTPCSGGDEIIDMWLDVGCNDLFGGYLGGTVRNADIAICNEELRSLFYDYFILFDLMGSLNADTARYNSILFALYNAAVKLNTFSDEEIKEARKILNKELARKSGDEALNITAIGHAHIDLAWLWPIRETIRKGARTFSTALELMERYPDYYFGQSQPQIYDWMKKYYPGLYSRIKDSVSEGRWEVQGAMWVEADTNIVSGESLVRQILYGKRFYKEEFGKDVQTLWLPDVFGYSGALPQILIRSGVNYFMTQKLSWNAHNKFPHHTFMWKGIDGTEILSHMLPEETYASTAAPSSAKRCETQYQDKGLCEDALLLFGISDGGGGPAPEYLERLSRMKNLNGIAPVKQDTSENFFIGLEKYKDSLKKWSGELYLERHQGTYTTQAKNKLFNRRMELALRELEFALILSGSEAGNHLKNKIDDIWKEVLLYQFHDIIPGSSIKRVYDESLARYEIMYKEVSEMLQSEYKKLVSGSGSGTAFNSLSWDRDEFVKINDRFYKASVPSLGYAQLVELNDEKFDIKADKDIIENSSLKIEFGKNGSIVRIYDKNLQREVLSSGSSGNALELFEDNGDCWDIPISYLDRPVCGFTLSSQKSYTDGPRAVMEQTYTYNNSRIEQKVILTEGSNRIDFVTHVDWHENLKMLRTSFDVNVKSEQASFEIQFGKIDRSTHENTSWDMAQFEVCGHKWADISQNDYGVALLNDCKYGYRVKDSVLDLTLLRSQNHPGENADRGGHDFTYSLYPHMGNLRDGNVVRAGYELNVPLTITDGICGNGSSSLFSINGSVIIDTIKRAEDSDATILRLYEPVGCSENTTLSCGRNYSSAKICDLMENEEADITITNNKIELSFRPFEIKTLKLIK